MGAITFRLSNEQESEIKRAAKMRNESVSEYIKKKIFQPINISTEVQIEKQKNALDEIVELLNNLIIQTKMSSSLQYEILKSVKPDQAKTIIAQIRETYNIRSV